MKLEIKNIKYFPTRSEETNNFTADIYVDGIKVGQADNDGQGGCTNYWVIKNELVGQLKAAEKYAETLPSTFSSYGDKTFEIKSNLEWVIDSAVEDFIQNKEKIKFNKAKEKAMLKGLVYSDNDTSFSTITWGKRTIAEVLAIPTGKQAIRTQIEKIRAKGGTVLNTNIPQELLA